ncbi:metallophosphoesterase [uncultured Anaerococcus sp.]|uniref:metallophosphoesterase n=1 Tax=uncultured Anaerococcus sp. TaxID=293428 RepID=UPI00280ACC0A|nr:metallophosphoesterase [uncultured Anaerococcus sp.]MDU5149370.1 metallophosphoesterase [Anaerococcus prevotii]
MKILVTSDTHGMYDSVSDYILTHEDIDLLIHAGDGLEDVKNIYYETGLNYYAVKGNNDFFINEEYEKVIDIDGKRLFLTHGHKYDVGYTYENLVEKAYELNCDIIVFGHIHTYVNEIKNDILLLNPGSPSLSRDGVGSFIILDINDKINVTKVSLN